jgi:hypothetical protein
MSVTYFVILPDIYYTTPQTLVLAEDQFFHSIGPKYSLFFFRQGSTVYLFVAMIFFLMDPLCIPHGHAFYFTYITWIHYILLMAMEISHNFINSMDPQCIFFSIHAYITLAHGYA